MMGILGMWTADLQDLSVFTGGAIYGLGDISSTQKRTGSYSFRCSANSTGFQVGFPLTATGYARFCFFTTNASDLAVVSSSNDHFYVRVSPSIMYLDLGSINNVVTQAAVSASINMWHTLEIYWIIAQSGGEIRVKLDGTTVLTWLDKDTYYTGAVGVASLSCWQYIFNSYIYWDDIIVRDDQWPGRGGIYVLTPNAGSTNEGWTASAGDPETCVDELPPVFTDYLSTDCTVDGTEHTVNVTDLAATPWNIRGVGVVAKTKATASTDAFARTLLQTGATKTEGATMGIETTGNWVNSYYALNPADSAVFEAADITNIEVGIESVVV